MFVVHLLFHTNCFTLINQAFVVCVAASFFTVTIEDEPQVIGGVGDIKQSDLDNKAKLFVLLNMVTLKAIWNQV